MKNAETTLISIKTTRQVVRNYRFSQISFFCIKSLVMEALTIHPKNKEQLNALEIILKAMQIPFEKETKEKDTYNPEFVAKIQKSRENYHSGKGSRISVRKLNELWR